MPTLLRYDAIRLLEASVECLRLAILGLGHAKGEYRQPASKYAPEIGLIGASAELGMAACLVQAFGPDALVLSSGRYKTAGRVLEEFRDLVRESTVVSEFLTQEVADPTAHRERLLQATVSFRRLIPVRAGGLHAGRGTTHEATVTQANDVSDFLMLLSKSSRIHPYLQDVPQCPWFSRDRMLVVEDLARRLQEGEGGRDPELLAAVYLVLPDIPEEEPEWIETFERVAIAPRRRDVEYLLDVLGEAVPATLRRTLRGGEHIPVVVRAGDERALPIAPQFLGRQFTDMAELWHADIATANGRLHQHGQLDLPPEDAVREVMAIGLERAGILNEDEDMSAHQSWPGILSSLFFQGTPGPYWFLVRRTDDLNQLRAILDDAVPGTGRLRDRADECFHGIEVIQDGQTIFREDAIFGNLIRRLASATENRMSLTAAQERNRDHPRALPEEYEDLLRAVSEGGENVGVLVEQVLEADVSDACITYWPRMLAEAATEADDIAAMVAILGSDSTSAGHTAARKALRRIDFGVHGPAVAEETRNV